MSSAADSGRPATRADVASRAGVSTAVVSYVLTGARRVRPDKAERVLAAVEALDYRPNGTARALRMGRADTLALIIPDISNPYYAEFARHVEVAAADRNQALIIASSHGDPETELRLLETLRSRSVDGVMVASVLETAVRPQAFLTGIPTMWIDALGPEEGATTIGTDAEAGSHALVRHLIEVHQCRTIGLALGRGIQSSEDPRHRGWLRALHEAGLSEGPTAETTWDREGGMAAGQELFSRDSLPDAIFATSDLIAIGLLRSAADHGITVPGDVALVSYDGGSESLYSIPRLTTLEQPPGPWPKPL